MLALAFSFSVFLYWTLLGRATITLVYPRVGVLRGWLLAPGVGLAIVLLGLMFCNQAGLPIRTCAAPLSLILGLAALGVMAWRRPISPGPAGAPFLLATVFGLLWAGWPAFESGFDWISYANDDMANYCLAAQRFLDHGFYDVPTLAELGGRDYSAYYFFMHVADMMRFGAEHIVAWGAAIARVQPTQSFMPLILALSLVQVAGAGALVLHLGRRRRRALVTMWLLAASPLFMLGTLYQLIAQVGGVALLLVVVALLTRAWVTPRRGALLRYTVLPAIISAALCIFYPEVTPFAGLTFAAFAVIRTIRERRLPPALVAIAAYTLVGVFVLLRFNVISYVSILVVQFRGAMHSANLLLSLFPYFMLPTGFANLFGWMPIAHDFAEPVISVSIAAGMILMTAILARSAREAWRLAPVAILLLIQFVFAARLFGGANDFGLYKLAMWMQPALAAGFAGWLLWWSRGRRSVAIASIALYAITATPTALYYTQASRGLKSGGLTELRLASKLGLHAQKPADDDAQLTSTIENVVAAKFAASELRGRPLALVSRDFFAPTTRTDFVHPTWPVRLHPHYEDMSQALPLIKERYREHVTSGLLWNTQFTHWIVKQPTEYYVSLDPRLSLFNKFRLGETPASRDSVFVIEPAAAARNQLLFVHSWLGNHYYLGDRRRISFFQQEQDLFAPGSDFNGIGRYMLLRVENPSPKLYLRIAATRTLVTDRTAWNPRAVIHADHDVPLDAVGNGAFNLFIGPITPRTFKDAKYLAIDFAENPQQLLDYRIGLKRLYNQEVSLDYRRLLGWARDISALTEEEYAALRRPRVISNFPDDLARARGLEFSGAYEDGWLSAHAKFVLEGARAGDLVRFRGFVPELGGSTLGTGRVRVAINDAEVCELALPLGRFDWLLPVPSGARTTKLDFQFSVAEPLPGRDRRPVSAKVELLGLLDGGTTVDCDYRSDDAPRLAADGVDQDGWAARTAAVLLPPTGRTTELTMQIEYPDWSTAVAGKLRAQVAGTDAGGSTDLVPGRTAELRIRLPAAANPRRLQLEAPGEFALPAPDVRRRAMRVLRVRLTPAAE